MTKDSSWRVRMVIFELLGFLGLCFEKDDKVKDVLLLFYSYLDQSAAMVRNEGIKQSTALAKVFGDDWITKEFIPQVHKMYDREKKGYNYRICYINSMAAVMPYMKKDSINSMVLPYFIKAIQDDVPNVSFCVCKRIKENRVYIDQNMFKTKLEGPLKEKQAHQDDDVKYYAEKALQS